MKASKSSRKTVHPFPARMAPEIVLKALDGLEAGSFVVDPMCGSGVVVREAVERGHRVLGIDIDPLAVLMTRVWTTAPGQTCRASLGRKVVAEARQLCDAQRRLPWIDDDVETKNFIDYWFAKHQQQQLRGLAAVTRELRGRTADLVRVAISRTIITKAGGASLAADTSHSRPHRVQTNNEYDVFVGFERSLTRLMRTLIEHPIDQSATVRHGDARTLRGVKPNSVDAIVTSPPYVNAIDYLRGHRLALVWFGYRISELRKLRAESIGSERAPETKWRKRILEIANSAGSMSELPSHEQRMVKRFVRDMRLCLGQTQRVLRPGGYAIFVVSKSAIRGVSIDTVGIVGACAAEAGLVLTSAYSREIPMDRRYLPPPQLTGTASLSNRMRIESVMRFKKVEESRIG